MYSLLVEGDDLGKAILLMLFIAFGVPILLLILGLVIRQKRKKASNVILIITAVYAIIGLGVCGALMI